MAMTPQQKLRRRNAIITAMMAYAAQGNSGGSSSTPDTEVTLTLTWTSGTGVLTPTFTLSGAIVEGDAITLSIYSDSGLTTLVDSDVNTVDAAEVLAGVIDFPGIGALAAGTYWAVATLSATGRTGTSNTETKTLVNFNPASLFTGGYLGVWLDASDTSAMKQNTNGTTNVTADGDLVGYYAEKSGNGYTIVASNNIDRKPTYKTDGTYHWLLHNNFPDLIISSSPVARNTGFFTIVMAVDITGGTGFRTLSTIADGSGNERATLGIDNSNKCYLRGRRVTTDATDSSSVTTNALNGNHILFAEFDYTNADGYIRNGSTLELTDTSFMTAGTSGNEGNGYYNITVSDLTGKLFQYLCINRQLTSDERNDLGAYFATKSGATY